MRRRHTLNSIFLILNYKLSPSQLLRTVLTSFFILSPFLFSSLLYLSWTSDCALLLHVCLSGCFISQPPRKCWLVGWLGWKWASNEPENRELLARYVAVLLGRLKRSAGQTDRKCRSNFVTSREKKNGAKTACRREISFSDDWGVKFRAIARTQTAQGEGRIFCPYKMRM